MHQERLGITGLDP